MAIIQIDEGTGEDRNRLFTLDGHRIDLPFWWGDSIAWADALPPIPPDLECRPLTDRFVLTT